MVFADRGETISGGNFHGEYPAKVSYVAGQEGKSISPPAIRQLLSGLLYHKEFS